MANNCAFGEPFSLVGHMTPKLVADSSYLSYLFRVSFLNKHSVEIDLVASASHIDPCFYIKMATLKLKVKFLNFNLMQVWKRLPLHKLTWLQYIDLPDIKGAAKKSPLDVSVAHAILLFTGNLSFSLKQICDPLQLFWNQG